MESGLVLVLLLCGLGIGANAQCSQTDNSCKNCPPGWSSFDGRCYRFLNGEAEWVNAERYCNFLGGNLASIPTSDIYHFVRDLVFKATGQYKRSWVAGNGAVKVGGWLWSDGSPFDQSFSLWGPGEPNNNGGNENCMEINMNGRDYVNDAICTQLSPYVCSRNP